MMLKRAKKKIIAFLTFDEGSYLLKAFNKLDNNIGLCLVDIGAAGDIEPRWKKIESHLDYVGFEPDERSCKELEKKPVSTKTRTIVPVALWSEQTRMDLHLCKKPRVSSVYEPNRSLLDKFPDSDRFNIEHIERLDCSTLDNVQLPQCDFIKIDIQGGELEVLRGAEASLEKVCGLELEVEFLSLYRNQPLFGSVCEFLSSKGFEFVDFVSISRWGRKRNYRGLGQAIFGVALFLRSPEAVLTVGDARMINAYLKVCLLYRRFDLVRVIYDGVSSAEQQKFNPFLKRVDLLERKFATATKVASLSTPLLRLLGGEYRVHLLY